MSLLSRISGTLRSLFLKQKLDLDLDEELNSYLNFETRNHISYGVTDDMYESLMSAVQDVIRESLGEDFTPQVEAGFKQRTDFLLSAIQTAAREEANVAV